LPDCRFDFAFYRIDCQKNHVDLTIETFLLDTMQDMRKVSILCGILGFFA